MSDIVGYRRYVKTMLVNALRRVFDGQYPNEDFRSLNISVEYPIKQQSYPAIWVGFDDTSPLTIAGVGHKELHPDGSGGWTEGTRWRFDGYVSLTAIALSSQERDALYDEIVRVVAFGHQNPAIQEFRRYVEVENDLIAANINFDTLEPRGESYVPGTPWGTDEFIYECGLSLGIQGEIVSDDHDGTLVALSAITTTAEAIFPDAAGVYPPEVPQDGTGGWI